MAVGNPNFPDTLITMTLERFLSKQPQDAIFQDNALFQLLKSRSKVTKKGGIKLLEPLMYGQNTTVQSYRGYDTFDISPQEGFTNAEYEWSEYGGSVTISQREEDINSGEPQVMDMLEHKWDQLRESLNEEINEDMYLDGTGNGGKDILGLGLLIDSAGTVGNISRTDNSWWSSQETPVGGALAVDGATGMRRMFNDCSYGKAQRVPNAILTTQAIYEAYEQLMAPYLRYTVTGEANAVFVRDNLAFRGAPLFWDGACTTGVMYFLNTRYMKWVFMEGRDFKMHPFVRPANQTARVALISVMFQLVINNARHLGKLTGITNA